MSLDLTQFDTLAPPPSDERAAPPTFAVIPNGLYTLVFPDGEHRTFKIHTKGGHGKLAGRRILSLLVGPDNESDYNPIGFVDDNGITLWKRTNTVKLRWYADLLWQLAIGESVEGYELMISKRCLRCSRTLSDPLSIQLQVGPECRKLMGMDW